MSKVDTKDGKAAKQAQVAEERVRFLEWFSVSLGQFEGLKAHHLNAVRAYFIGLGIPDPAKPSAYDAGLEKFGLKRAK